MQAAVIFSLALVMVGCGSSGSRPEPPAVATGPDPAAIAGFEQALAALRAGDETAAEARLQALVTAYPEYSGPLFNLARIRAAHGEPDPAIALLERALAVCSHCAASWNELGMAQRQQGRFRDAEQSYLKAITADPGYANAYFNLGILYELYLARPELALEQYARFRELKAGDPAAGDVEKWIADLSRRTKPIERSAQVEDSG
jgi:tetratricopeptide (TPR) repeat protein